MAELKTKLNDASVEAFLNSVPDEGRRADSFIILEMMKQVAGAGPKMWGESIIGFGNQHLKYESGRELDWFMTGFSPRKHNLTLYLTFRMEDHPDLMQRLGKFKTGKGCLYINKLQDVNLDVLKELVQVCFQDKTRG